jgi:hypothetical protein
VTGAPHAPGSSRRLWLGCGLALALIAAFLLGVVVTSFVFSAWFLPAPPPAVASDPGGAALKITVTDTLLTDEMNANSNGVLTNIQTHIAANGQVSVSGILQGTLVGEGQTAVIVLAPRVSQGKITVTAVSGSVGGFLLPAYVLAPIASKVTTALSQSSSIPISGSQQLTVKGLTFTNGALTISYS